MIPLHDGWTLTGVAGPIPDELRDRLAAGIPARVPGVVHDDLHAAGLIDDIDDDDVHLRLLWIGESTWCYRRDLDAPANAAGAHVDLVAEGLDTFCEVTLNGNRLGESRNQHRSYRWPVGHLLEGRNTIQLVFAPPIQEARRAEERLGHKGHLFDFPYNAVRKAAYNFGWDWGPAAPTSGIWKPIRLEIWDGVRFDIRRVEADPVSSQATVDVDLSWHPLAVEPVAVELTVGHTSTTVLVTPGQPQARLRVHLDDCRRWNPRGYGDQHLYPIRVAVGEQSWDSEIGFRDVGVERSGPDGQGFTLRVNGRPVHVKGFNIIPPAPVPRPTAPGVWEELVEEAVGAGANLVRVWGGGYFASEELLRTCSRRGVLVWHDFLFACADYSEEPELANEIEAESSENTSRIGHHASLMLWCGGNENEWIHYQGAWKSVDDGRPWGQGYFRRMLPAIVAERAPGTVYIPNSPFSWDSDDDPNSDASAISHLWEVWNEKDYVHYLESAPRFVAEFGWAAPATSATLLPHLSDSSVSDKGLAAHLKAADGWRKLSAGLEAHVGAPPDLDQWFFAAQLVQARACSLAIQHFRTSLPGNSGHVLWQLNDCWPALSWSVLDSDHRRKPAWFAVRQANADRLLSLAWVHGDLTLHAVNDTDLPWSAELRLIRSEFDGRMLSEHITTIDVGPRMVNSNVVPRQLSAPRAPREEFVAARSSTGHQAIAYFASDRELALPPSPISATACEKDGRYVVDVVAHAFARDLTLLVDRVDPSAVVDDGFVCVLPGETVRFVVAAPGGLDPQEFLRDDVLQTANILFSIPAARS